MELAKFRYSPLRKALEKHTEKQFDTLKSLNVSNKEDNESKLIQNIFPRKHID